MNRCEPAIAPCRDLGLKLAPSSYLWNWLFYTCRRVFLVFITLIQHCWSLALSYHWGANLTALESGLVTIFWRLFNPSEILGTDVLTLPRNARLGKMSQLDAPQVHPWSKILYLLDAIIMWFFHFELTELFLHYLEDHRDKCFSWNSCMSEQNLFHNKVWLLIEFNANIWSSGFMQELQVVQNGGYLGSGDLSARYCNIISDWNQQGKILLNIIRML